MKSITCCLALLSVAFIGSAFGRSPPAPVLPENCVFLTNMQTSRGGEYSYIDPVGSLIKITYKFDSNRGYTESRKVILDYASGHSGSSGQVNNVNTVIAQVIREIEIQVTTTIQEVLRTTNVNAPSFQASNLVQVIIKKLRPIITITVSQIILGSGLNLKVDEVVGNVVAQIQPSILQGVQSGIQGVSSTSIGINKSGQKPMGVLSGNGENSAQLIDQLIAQLRPIIVQFVNEETKIQCQNHSGGSTSTGFGSTSTSFGSSSPTSGAILPSVGSSRPSSGFSSTSSSGFSSSSTSFGSSRPSSGSVSTSFSSRPSSGSSRPSSGSSRPSSGSVSTSFSSRPSSGSSQPSSGSSRPSSGSVSTSFSSRPSSGSSRPSSGSSRPSSGSVSTSFSSRPSSGSSRPSSGFSSTSSSGFSSSSTSFGSSRPSSGFSSSSSTFGSNSQTSGSTFSSGGQNKPTNAPKKSISTTEINQLTDDLVEIIVEMLKDDIQSAVLFEIRAHSENDDEVLADAILASLRSSIIRVIRNTVNSNSKFSGFKSDIESLTTRILNKLRPIILSSIKAGFKKVREETNKKLKALQEQLIDAIVSQLQARIEEEVEAELRSYTGSLANANKQSLIGTIVNRLRPIILSALKNAQRSDSRFSSISASTFNSLVDQIISRLQPLILQSIEDALRNAELEGQLIDTVIKQIQGQIEQEVKSEIAGFSGSLTNLNKEKLIDSIINRLRPIILSVLRNFQRSDSRYSSISTSQFDYLVNQIVDGLRPIIIQFIDAALQTAVAEGQIIEVATSQVRGQVETVVNAELQGYSGSLDGVNRQSLLDVIIRQLRPIILSTLKGLKRTDSRFISISASQFDGYFTIIVDRLRPFILELIESNLQILNSQDSLIEELIAIVTGDLEGEIKSFVVRELNGLRDLNNVNLRGVLQVVSNKMIPLIRRTVQTIFRTQSRFAILSSQLDSIIERILEALRPIILEAIEFNADALQEERIKAATKPVDDKIVSLFGISGENNVKVETPKFNYQYAIDFNKKNE